MINFKTKKINSVYLGNKKINSAFLGNIKVFSSEIAKVLHLNNYELVKINEYSDFIFKNEPNNPYYDSNLIENAWYKKTYINKKIYDENDAFQLGGASNDNYYIFQVYGNSVLLDKSQSIHQMLSNRFVCNGNENPSINANTEQIAVNQNAYGNLRFTISASRLVEKSVQAFQNWLSNNNVTIYYVLETPLNIQITEIALINELEGVYSILSLGTVTVENELENAPLIVENNVLKGNLIQDGIPTPDIPKKMKIVTGWNKLKII